MKKGWAPRSRQIPLEEIDNRRHVAMTHPEKIPPTELSSQLVADTKYFTADG